MYNFFCLFNNIRGFENTVSILLMAGCEINLQDKKFNTALHYSVTNNHLRLTELLLNNATIDIDLYNIENLQPI